MADKDLAVEALEATIATKTAVRDKLEQIITVKKFQLKDVDQERADVAKLNREIADCRNLLPEVRAASTVVSAPTVAEIQAVMDLARQIQQAAVEDAMVQAGLDLLKEGLAQAAKLRDKVKT